MWVRGLVTIVFAAAITTACTGQPTLTPSAIDQSYAVVASECGHADNAVVQTFTAGRSGVLDKITLTLERGPGSFTIQTTSGGNPTGTVIGHVDAPGPYASFPDSVPVDLPLDIAAPVTAGVRYAIVSGAEEELGICYGFEAASTYPDGQLIIDNHGEWFARDDVDLPFATWVR